jgi:hypothetical protein
VCLRPDHLPNSLRRVEVEELVRARADAEAMKEHMRNVLASSSECICRETPVRADVFGVLYVC